MMILKPLSNRSSGEETSSTTYLDSFNSRLLSISLACSLWLLVEFSLLNLHSPQFSSSGWTWSWTLLLLSLYPPSHQSTQLLPAYHSKETPPCSQPQCGDKFLESHSGTWLWWFSCSLKWPLTLNIEATLIPPGPKTLTQACTLKSKSMGPQLS